ncbi:MAG: hypothetical protein EXQ77_01410 [Thermoleophilia bacterium]|nr:hypothetical protein [Thermoleophilia bacterium]
MTALALAALLGALCVVAVALPFLREPAPTFDRLDVVDERGRRAVALGEERDRALAALRELEADHRTGLVDDTDYRASVGPLRVEVAAALRALDALAQGQEDNRRNLDG